MLISFFMFFLQSNILYIYTLNRMLLQAKPSGCRPKCCYNQSELFFYDHRFHDRSSLSQPSTQVLDRCCTSLIYMQLYIIVCRVGNGGGVRSPGSEFRGGAAFHFHLVSFRFMWKLKGFLYFIHSKDHESNPVLQIPLARYICVHGSLHNAVFCDLATIPADGSQWLLYRCACCSSQHRS